jgi:hypothetical protein
MDDPALDRRHRRASWVVLMAIGEPSRVSWFSSAALADLKTVGDDRLIVQIYKPKKEERG